MLSHVDDCGHRNNRVWVGKYLCCYFRDSRLQLFTKSCNITFLCSLQKRFLKSAHFVCVCVNLYKTQSKSVIS